MNCQSLEKGFLILQCRSFSRPCRIPNIFHHYPEYRFLSQSCLLCQNFCESPFPGSISRIPLTFLGSRETLPDDPAVPLLFTIIPNPEHLSMPSRIPCSSAIPLPVPKFLRIPLSRLHIPYPVNVSWIP